MLVCLINIRPSLLWEHLFLLGLWSLDFAPKHIEVGFSRCAFSFRKLPWKRRTLPFCFHYFDQQCLVLIPIQSSLPVPVNDSIVHQPFRVITFASGFVYTPIDWTSTLTAWSVNTSEFVQFEISGKDDRSIRKYINYIISFSMIWMKL